LVHPKSLSTTCSERVDLDKDGACVVEILALPSSSPAVWFDSRCMAVLLTASGVLRPNDASKRPDQLRVADGAAHAVKVT